MGTGRARGAWPRLELELVGSGGSSRGSNVKLDQQAHVDLGRLSQALEFNTLARTPERGETYCS